jgi:hypothetical protein
MLHVGLQLHIVFYRTAGSRGPSRDLAHCNRLRRSNMLPIIRIIWDNEAHATEVDRRHHPKAYPNGYF